MKIFLNVLSGIGLLAWCSCFALGFNYQQGGALTISLLLFVFLIAFLGMLLYLMKRWSNPKISDHKANAKKREMICGALYVLAIIFSVGGVAQFITVQTSVKNEVSPLVQQRIMELERVFGDENTQGSYLHHIQEIIMPTYTKYLESKYDDDNTIQLALSRLQDELTKDGDFTVLQDNVESFLGYCRYSVQNWVPWTVSAYISELDNNIGDWEAQVTEMSTNHEWASSEPFVINSIAKDKLVNRIINPSDSIFSGLAILLMIVMQVVILLSYLAGRDWSHNVRKPDDRILFATWKGNSKPAAKNDKGNNNSNKKVI